MERYDDNDPHYRVYRKNVLYLLLQNCQWINMDKQTYDKNQRGMKYKVGMNVEGSAFEDKNKKW